mmetsp:Transcript_17515/g.28719  ORF Transcript_17515/g.28719 Transcript_17515/m.28719 type:complete len:201 (+) Transcript_17515:2-604(+)
MGGKVAETEDDYAPHEPRWLKPNAYPRSNQELVSDEEESVLPEEGGACCGDRLMIIFGVIQMLTTLTAATVVVANIYYFIYKWGTPDLNVKSFSLRLYAIIFCVLVAFAEFEWRGFFHFFGFLENWITRGLFYIFVSLLTLSASDEDASDAFFNVAGYIMFAAGALYAFMGLACLKTIKETHMHRENVVVEERVDEREFG